MNWCFNITIQEVEPIISGILRLSSIKFEVINIKSNFESD